MKEKLSRIRAPWRRLLVSLFLSSLVFMGRFKSSRSYMHWIGHAHRPRRLERLLSVFLLFIAMVFLEPRQYVLWCAVWGGAASLFVILQSVRKLAPRKQFHWVRSKK